MPRRNALLSVSDKTGLVDLAKQLYAAGIRLISTGGTARHLRDAGLTVVDISEVTGFPEMLDGRVKTLHPVVHGGLLARRDLAEHMNVIQQHGIEPIDFVIVNLYPFAETAAKLGISEEEVVEQIDIGGPSMLRSAAKNFGAVTVVVDPADYERVGRAVAESGETSPELRAELAAKVFQHTSLYDSAIANYLFAHLPHGAEADAPRQWPAVYTVSMPLAQPMRYGENPHQAAAFYRDPACHETSLATARQLHGKELSYNNILDAEGALEMVRDFAPLAPAAVTIVKHSNPCGIGIGPDVYTAYERARATDPDSAFGGIISVSAAVDEKTAAAINETFNEIVIAPAYEPAALEILRKKKNLRVLETGPFTPKMRSHLMRGIVGGMVVTDRDLGMPVRDQLRVVTRMQPTSEDLEGLLFAWTCVKWVKSNAIVYTNHTGTVGIGAGQMSRIDAANFGAAKARTSLAGCYMASDAFFPFRDCVDIAARHGIRGIIQPGGSVRDEDSIKAADEFGIVMLFTGMRHFRH